MQQPFATLQNKRRVGATVRVLQEVANGKTVSKKRLSGALEHLCVFLGEVNSRRPHPPIRCGGNI